MPHNPERLDHLFIVRIWNEAAHGGDGWRGSVEHVPSGQRMYFVSFKDLNDFIQLRTRSQTKSTPSPLEENTSA